MCGFRCSGVDALKAKLQLGACRARNDSDGPLKWRQQTDRLSDGWDQLLPTNDRNSWWQRRATAGNCEWAWLGAVWKIILGARRMQNNSPAAVCNLQLHSSVLRLAERLRCWRFSSRLRLSLWLFAELFHSFFKKDKTISNVHLFRSHHFLESGSKKKKIPTQFGKSAPLWSRKRALTPPPGGATSYCSWGSPLLKFFFFFFLALDRHVEATTEHQQCCCQVYLLETTAAKALSKAAAAGSLDGKCWYRNGPSIEKSKSGFEQRKGLPSLTCSCLPHLSVPSQFKELIKILFPRRKEQKKVEVGWLMESVPSWVHIGGGKKASEGFSSNVNILHIYW